MWTYFISGVIVFLVMVWINYLHHKYPQKLILHLVDLRRRSTD